MIYDDVGLLGSLTAVAGLWAFVLLVLGWGNCFLNFPQAVDIKSTPQRILDSVNKKKCLSTNNGRDHDP